MEADQDRDGKISFDEFTKMVENTDVSMSMTLGKSSSRSPPLSMSILAFVCKVLNLRLELLLRRKPRWGFYLRWTSSSTEVWG